MELHISYDAPAFEGADGALRLFCGKIRVPDGMQDFEYHTALKSSPPVHP